MCFLPHQLLCTPLDPFLDTYTRSTHSLPLFCDSSAHTGVLYLSEPCLSPPFLSWLTKMRVFSVTQHVPMAIVFISHTFFFYNHCFFNFHIRGSVSLRICVEQVLTPLSSSSFFQFLHSNVCVSDKDLQCSDLRFTSKLELNPKREKKKILRKKELFPEVSGSIRRRTRLLGVSRALES